MTEVEWLTCADPKRVLDFLQGERQAGAGDRKARLFACGCCRRVFAREEQTPAHLRWLYQQPPGPEEHRADIEFFRRAVALAEDVADGRRNDPEWAAVNCRFQTHPVTGCPAGYDLCGAAKPDWTPIAAFEFIARTVATACQEPVDAAAAAEFSGMASASIHFLETGPEIAAQQVEKNKAQLQHPRTAFESTYRFQRQDGDHVRWIADTGVEEANGYAVLAAFAAAQSTNAAVIRDIFGNPFRPATIRSTPLHPAAVSLANAIYDERAFDRLLELADTLERTGCTNADVLAHCRGPGPHVRGCWVVDLILGKK